MTVNSNPMMASYSSQISNNRSVQSQNSANGYAPQGVDAGKSFDAIAKLLMSALDTNKTGSVDKTEFSEAAKTLAKNESSENVENAFNRIDANNDAKITFDEFLSVLKEAGDKKQQHKQQTDMNALNSTLLSDQTNKLTQLHTQTNDTQKSFLDKVMAAYGSTTATTGTRTNIAV